MQFIIISTDLKGWCLGANYRLLLQRGKGPSLQRAHDNTQDLEISQFLFHHTSIYTTEKAGNSQRQDEVIFGHRTYRHPANTTCCAGPRAYWAQIQLARFYT